MQSAKANPSFPQRTAATSSVSVSYTHLDVYKRQERGLTTSSTAVFVPFTTQELFQGGEALYYGLNALSNNCLLYTSHKEKVKVKTKDRGVEL